MVGVVRDRVDWGKWHAVGGSSAGRLVHGALYGNGKAASDPAGKIKDGQIVSMELDADAGTLKFWMDIASHMAVAIQAECRGACSGRRVVYCKDNFVQIVEQEERRRVSCSVFLQSICSNV